MRVSLQLKAMSSECMFGPTLGIGRNFPHSIFHGVSQSRRSTGTAFYFQIPIDGLVQFLVSFGMENNGPACHSLLRIFIRTSSQGIP